MSHIVRRPILVAALGSPCPYCGMAMLGDRQPSRDHIRPRSYGHGLLRNRAIVCMRCNRDKGDQTMQQFLVELVAVGDPRAAHVEAFIRKRRRR